MAWAGTKSYVVSTGMVSGTLTNYPALFAWTDPTFKSVANGGSLQTGWDLALFEDSGGSPGTMLDMEREYWNAATGEIAIRARVPSLTVGTKVHAQYGDASIVATLDNPTGVWDSNFRLVDHLGDGTTLTPVDSTASPLTPVLVNTPTAVAGITDGGMGLASASTQSLNYGAPSKLDFSGAFTYSLWYKPTSFPDAYGGLITKSRNVGGNYAFLSFLLKSNGKLACFICRTASDGTAIFYDGNGVHTLTAGTWYLLTMTYNPAYGIRSYVNGIPDGVVNNTSTIVSTTGLTTNIGNDIPFGPRRLNGVVDEIRISGTERSAEWERATYLNRNVPKQFWSVPADTRQSQLGIEVLGLAVAPIRVSQFAIEVVSPPVAPIQVSQLGAEVVIYAPETASVIPSVWTGDFGGRLWLD